MQHHIILDCAITRPFCITLDSGYSHCWHLKSREISCSSASEATLKIWLNTLMWIRYGPLTRYIKLYVAHAPECREGFPRHQLQMQPLVSDPGMHPGTCMTHVPWCMSGSLTHGGGENAPSITSACATHNFTYLARGPWIDNIATTIQSKRKLMMTPSNGNIFRVTGPSLPTLHSHWNSVKWTFWTWIILCMRLANGR